MTSSMISLRWRQLIWRLALILGAYSLLRGIFFSWNHSLFVDVGAVKVAKAFFAGLRFDLAAVFVITAPVVLLTMLPWQSHLPRSYERLTKFLFLALNFPFLVINIVDIEYVQFTGRRADLTLLGVGRDVGVKWHSLALEFWPLVLLGVLIMAALYFLYDRMRGPETANARPMSVLAWAASLLAILVLAVVAIRGGVQKLPINLVDAAVQNHYGLTQLTLNSSFTVIRSYGKHTLKKYDYFSAGEQLRQYLRPFVNGENLLRQPAPRDNLVILVVESLSAEYCGAGNGGGRYTPFLDSLAAQSLFLRHHYANGRRSIEAMPSILAGLPSLMDQSLAESSYSDHPILGLGSLLSPHGYTTSFFHGATKGTMRFDVFMRQAGIENYFGRADYPDQADFAGDWGIFDEPYLQYVAKQLTTQKPPFAAVAFTLTSHPPYPIPTKYRGRFNKGTLAIHESIGYADHALAEFFATARQQPWYSNTLFVITGDHTQKLETPEYSSILGHHRVPLLFFHPQHRFAMVDPNRVTQHVDILPSLLDFLQIQPDQQLLFGRSVFRAGEGRAFLHQSGHFWLVRGGRALEFTPASPSRLFDLANDLSLQQPLTNEPERFQAMELEAKALLQYFNNGLLQHQLYDRVLPFPTNQSPKVASPGATRSTGHR